ncbi:MAG: hypothetical protein QOF88_2417 [Mycobacterium sp.]|jgi:hypothetical protein|nr:hypothetical protein [Mycobacterium sp.]
MCGVCRRQDRFEVKDEKDELLLGLRNAENLAVLEGNTPAKPGRLLWSIIDSPIPHNRRGIASASPRHASAAVVRVLALARHSRASKMRA